MAEGSQNGGKVPRWREGRKMEDPNGSLGLELLHLRISAILRPSLHVAARHLGPFPSTSTPALHFGRKIPVLHPQIPFFLPKIATFSLKILTLSPVTLVLCPKIPFFCPKCCYFAQNLVVLPQISSEGRRR